MLHQTDTFFDVVLSAFVCDVKAEICRVQDAVVSVRVWFTSLRTHVIAWKLWLLLTARLPNWGCLCYDLTCREQISTSCRMLEHGSIPLKEQSLLIYLEDAAACGAGKTSVHQGLMSEGITHAFWSSHQYFYLIRSFLHWTAVESGNGCSNCCTDSSFTILPQENRESLYILPACLGAPPLLL